MADTDFVPGQRWVSNTESELGLGIVVENADRRVTLSFPAAGERRVYASDNAPLSRVVYAVGETIKSDDGVALEVTELHESEGCIVYGGTDADGRHGILAELDLDCFVQFSRPLDRLFAGQIDKNNSFLLRAETLTQFHRHAQSPACGLLGPRVQLLPHQFYIAREVAGRYRPRVLLADEVGLGKTIEAGLILHQQLLTGRAERVLIVVPDSLIHQWLVEMLRRFNLHFTILSEETCVALEEADEENPFETAQLILVGLSLLVDRPARQAQALAASWDLMVVDEAHHLRWEEDEASPAYRATEALAREAAGLILITATPEQLGVEGHFARLRLLDPARYHDLAAFRAEEANYRPIAELVGRLLEPSTAEDFVSDAPLQERLEAQLGGEAVEAITAADASERRSLIASAVRNLLDRHGTGRVLFRNCRDTIHGFPERRLHTYPLTAPREYLRHCEGAQVEALLNPEVLLGEAWVATDPRVLWLAEWLAEHRPEKTLVICARTATAVTLEEHLRVRHGLRSAVFHEDMGLVARDRAAAYFADEQDNAEALICSEIGSEGRNFQFASHLVLFDIPLNPDLLEQRIGRLDRIGQRNVVELHVPYYESTAAEVLVNWYHEGLDALEHVFPAGSLLFDQCEALLREVLHNPTDETASGALIERTRAGAMAARKMLQQGRDPLLELNSCDAGQAAFTVGAVSDATRTLELADYMDRVFDYFGVELQPHGALSVIVHPGDHMLCHSFPGLPEGGITGTYDRSEALSHEDMHFLTWEHPMVTGAMDMMIAGEFGNATLCALKAPYLKPGTLILEAIFVVNCTAPRWLQLRRYIPRGTIRVVVDRQQKDVSEILTSERINASVQHMKARIATEVAKHARGEITKMAERAAEIAQHQLAPMIEAAERNIDHEQGAELDRLQALAAVNQNIRPEEIAYRKQCAVELLAHLANTQLKLDAVRVGLAT